MQRVDNLVLLQLHESQIYIERVCLILTLLNFIMILQICLSLSVNNKAQVVVSLQMQVVAKSSTRILLLYCGSMLNVSCLLSKYTKDSEECQFQCLDTPECLSVNIESAFKGDGELQLCQLLASTKERKSENLVASVRFDHYPMKVSKYLFLRMPLLC